MMPIRQNLLHRCRDTAPRTHAMRWVVAGGAVALLAACGGGGGGSDTNTTPPGGGGGGASGYYLSGPSGDSIRGLTLTGVDPTTAGKIAVPSDYLYSANLGTLAQWTATGGTATKVGTRFRVWAGTDNVIYSTDLGITSSSTGPTTTAFSTYMATSICAGIAPTVLDDLANPVNSAIVFRDNSVSCGSPTDTFVTIPLSANAGTTPPAPSIYEPVDVARDASGAIKKVLFLIHTSPAAVGIGSSFAATPTVLGSVPGLGINLQGTGDFTSLAVVPQADGSLVWLYRAFNQIFAVNLTTLGAPVAVFTASDNDVIQLPVLVEGTTMYVAMTDSTNVINTPQGPQYTCQVVRINSAAPLTSNSGIIALQENTASGLSLVGLVGNDIVYFDNDVTTTVGVGGATYAGPIALETIPKTSTNLAGPVTTIATATQPNAWFDTSSAPIAVSGGLYYTIDTAGAGPAGTTGYQAYFYGGGTPVAIGGSGSIVVGGASATPVSTANPAAPAYTSAILVVQAQGGNLPGSSIVSYAAGGNAAATLGTLPNLQNDTYSSFTLSEGPLQSGMPALLTVYGTRNNGNPAQDLFQFTPGTAASLHQVTTNLQ